MRPSQPVFGVGLGLAQWANANAKGPSRRDAASLANKFSKTKTKGSTVTEQVKFEGFAIVELMGRSVVAGYVSEIVVAGAAMLRVDVPAVGEQKGFSKLYGGSAIYAITPTDEETAKRAAENLRQRPVEPWIVPSAPVDRRLVDGRVRQSSFGGFDDDFGGDDE